MQDVLGLLACPACGGALSSRWSCEGCGAQFHARDGIPDLRLRGDARTEVVRGFYEATPFPGYPARDSLSHLHARAERNEFAKLIDRAIPGDARVADIGCGTGQMSLYLGRADRIVIGADLARTSLTLATAAARRYGVHAVHFVETDLHRPGLRAGAFDVVFSSGVLHHTQDPRAAFGRIARLARPGGVVVVGVYNAFARIPSRLRRLAAGIAPRHAAGWDPVLRLREREPDRRDAWLRGQYQHPEEHRHTVAEVRGWFRENGVDLLRTYPSVMFEDGEVGDLFSRMTDDWSVEEWLAQLGWIWTLGREGGLFFTIGRKSTTPNGL